MSAPMSHSAQHLAASRAHAPHTSMFFRMLVRAAILRRGRAASALFAMVVAAAVATAMLNLYVDVQAKLRREFRNYGANIILVGKDAASLPADSLSHVDSVLAGRGIAAPFGLIVARTCDGQPIVVAGMDFERVRQLEKWWSVSSWPSEIPSSGAQITPEIGHPALIGVRALPMVRPRTSRSTSAFKDELCTSVPPARCRQARPKTAAFTLRLRTSSRGRACSLQPLKSRPAALPKRWTPS